MRVKVTKQFLWAPDGIHVRTVQVGEELEDEGAEVALQMKSGEVIESAAQEPPPVAARVEESLPAAPSDPAPTPKPKKGR